MAPDIAALDAGPTARALLALELVQNNPGITADRLGERLGVTSRAARRYVAVLREAGIPIASVSGPTGGYRPGRGLRPPPLLFTPAEALGLVMAVLDGHHDLTDPDDPVGSAIGKILRTLPESVAAQAETVRRVAAPAPDRPEARPAPDATATLVQACADRREVRIGYRTEAGRELELDVQPWAVVVRHSRWYLLCHSLTSSATRAYRVDRVRGVELREATFEPPADLEPVSALEQHLGEGWEFPVEVVVQAPAEVVQRCIPRTMGRVEPGRRAQLPAGGQHEQPQRVCRGPGARARRLPRRGGGRGQGRDACAGRAPRGGRGALSALTVRPWPARGRGAGRGPPAPPGRRPGRGG